MTIEKTYLHVSAIMVLLALAGVREGGAAEEWVPVPIQNPSLSSADGRTLHGWTLHNARIPKGNGGMVYCVELPVDRRAFAKVYQRAHFVRGTVAKFRVRARLLTQSYPLDGESHGNQDAYLRIMLFPPDAEWDWKRAVWPEGRRGAVHRIQPCEEWTEQTFELECPESAEVLEVSLACTSPAFTVFVEDVQLEAVLRLGETASSAFSIDTVLAPTSRQSGSGKKEDEKDTLPPANAFWGLSTDFEVGRAGWQYYILPHYPPTGMGFQWETNRPGEGVRSVIIKPGFGLNNMPAPVKGNTEYTFSMLIRGEPDGQLTISSQSGDRFIEGIDIPAVGEWRRKSFTFRTPADSSHGVTFLIQNRADPRSGRNIYLDALCLSEGKSKEYVPGRYSLSLSSDLPGNICMTNQDVTVRATLKINQSGQTPSGDWHWTVTDVAPRERVLLRKKVQWNETEIRDFYRASVAIPAGQGLYRVVLLEGDEELIDPTHELLVGQATFEGLPKLPDDPRKGFLGVHYHNNWHAIDEAPYQLNLDTAQAERWAMVHHMGARWIRLHGGRPDPTKMYEVYPRSFDEPRFYVGEMTALRDLGFEIVGLLEVGFSKEKRSPWFKHKETQGAWMGTQIPKDLEIWDRYVSDVVAGYRDVISFWEIYNEPNGQMSPQDYIPLLKHGYETAKAVNPDITVLGICSTTDFGTELDDFVIECLNAECGDYLDVLTFHPYIGYRSPESGNSADVMRTMRELRDKYAPGKPLWNSEVGWRTYPCYITHMRRARDKNLTALDGAAYTARNLLEAKRSGLHRYFAYGGAHVSFAFQNREFSPLLEYDGSPSPLYFTVGTAVRMLHDVKFRTDLKLGDGVYAYLFDRADGSIMAAVWTDNEVIDRACLLKTGTPPDAAWDGIGRACDLSAAGVEVSRVPVYLLWRAASAPEVAAILEDATLSNAEDAYAIIRLDTENRPVLALTLRNTTASSAEFVWRPGVGQERRIVAKPGEATEVDYVPLRPFGGAETLAGELKLGFLQATDVSIGSRYAVLGGSVPQGLLIDGVTEEWEGPSAFALDNPTQITAGKISSDRLREHPVRIRGAVDTNAMYLAVEVSKEKRGWTQNRLGKGQFNMDSVELFFRTRVREVDWLDPAYRNGDIKLSLAQDSEHPEQKHISVDRGDAFVSTNGIAFAFSDMAVGPGSVCEIRIPWTALTDFQDGKPDFLGFDMSINLSEDGNTRTHQYTWSGTGDNWRDTRRFGILKVQ